MPTKKTKKPATLPKPAKTAQSSRVQFGMLAGQVTVPPDFDAPLPPDVQASFEGKTSSPFGGRPPPMLNLHDRAQLQAVLEVIEALQGVPLGGKLQFFLGRKGSLGAVTPLEALAQGRLEKVLDTARAFADYRPEVPLPDLGGRAPDIEPAPRRRPAALVTTDSDVCGGRPCFPGHRLPIEMVLARLGAGDSMASLQSDYPWLTDAHVAAARAYAALVEAADITFDPPKAVIAAKPVDLSDD